jgi:hypothetical protein
MSLAGTGLFFLPFSANVEFDEISELISAGESKY